MDSENKHVYVGKYLHARTVDEKVSVMAYAKFWVINLKLCIENNTLNVFKRLLFKKAKSYKKILIFRTGSLGDSINAIPSIQAIADNYPNAQVDILTNAGKENLVGLRYLIPKTLYNELIDYYELPKKQLFSLLKRKDYNLVVQLPQVDASFFKLLRDLIVFSRIAASGMGWFTSQASWFRKTQSKYLIFENESTRLLEHLRKNQFFIKISIPKLNILNSDREYASNLIANCNLDLTKRKICVVIGAKRPQNRWPIDSFKEVVAHFSNRFIILLIGSEEDSLLATTLLQITGVINFCGLLTPMQSAAVISLCDITLSNDTGPMHMSYAVGTPTVALFSSRDLPGKWYPPEKSNLVFRSRGIKCEACFSETCRSNICMQAIMPSNVIGAMEKILALNMHKEI